MNGPTHQLIANLALSCLEIKERHILYPRWGGIESGATLSDDFRIMWEPDVVGSKAKQLVHRYFVDSDDPKDHGCVTRAWDHATGSIGFIEEYLSGGLEGAYTEDEFLENLGMFLGILCHHVADLCSPVHVGHKMDYSRAGSKSRRRFHSTVERDIVHNTKHASCKLVNPRMVKLSQDYFRRIAINTYKNQFLRIEDIYANNDVEGKVSLASCAISCAVKYTADLWHTIIFKSGMLQRQWSMQSLI